MSSVAESIVSPEISAEPHSEVNVWTAILSEVQKKGGKKLPSNKQVVVLGDQESGKTTLIAKLQGIREPQRGLALEYFYIDIHNEYNDDETRLGVWALGGHESFAPLLRFALPAVSLPNTLVMFMASMRSPWNILEQLRNWATVLETYIESLKVPTNQMQNYRQAILRKWLAYSEEFEDTPTYLDNFQPEGVLTSNLGVDVIVVITMTDYASALEKQCCYTEEHFSFIQQSIRKFCLEYGAALFYTSAKEDKNCNLLMKYVTQRLYGFPLSALNPILEKESILIPAGWDSKTKINIFCENFVQLSPNDPYESVLCPSDRKMSTQDEEELVAEDEQVFLAKMLTLLQLGQSKVSTPTPQKTAERKTLPIASPGGLLSPRKMEPAKPSGMPNEGVLATFFNSLLYKKTGSPCASPGVSPSVKALNRTGKSLVRPGPAAVDDVFLPVPSDHPTEVSK